MEQIILNYWRLLVLQEKECDTLFEACKTAIEYEDRGIGSFHSILLNGEVRFDTLDAAERYCETEERNHRYE